MGQLRCVGLCLADLKCSPARDEAAGVSSGGVCIPSPASAPSVRRRSVANPLDEYKTLTDGEWYGRMRLLKWHLNKRIVEGSFS